MTLGLQDPAFLASASRPSLITNGLLVYLDSKQSASYPGSGTTWTNLIGGGNNGTLVGGVGFSEGALTFDGVNDIVAFSDTDLLPTAGLTVSMWLRTAVADKWALTKGTGANTSGYCLAGTVAGGLSFGIGTGTSSRDATTATSITGNAWIQAVGTWTPSSAVRLYLNGGLAASNTTTIPASLTNPSSTLKIGGRGNGTDWWNGGIGPTLIYNRALSDSEVLQNFGATSFLDP